MIKYKKIYKGVDNMIFYPLRLKPIRKKIIWGGNYISNNFGIGEKNESIAEAWMMTMRPDGVNIIENGKFKGMTLEEYINEIGISDVCGTHDAFPLLIKLIDANDKLSVQVHPDDIYAHANGLDAGKTEMWYVVDAKEGAKLVSGLKVNEPPTFDEILERNQNGTLEEILNYVDVKKGDCFFIPAGLVHAIGKGIAIAEIQQNSNTTFRLFDYNRTDKDGNKRELHIEEASNVIKTKFDENAVVNRIERKNEKEIITTLCDCDLFAAVKYELSSNVSTCFSGGKMLNVMCLDGYGYISYENQAYELKKGFSYLIPKGMKSFTINTNNCNLEIIVSSAK